MTPAARQFADTAEQIEVINPDFPRGPFRAAIFDFDGTLSLLRRNWQNVMIPMMVDVLADTNSGETQEELFHIVEEFVMRLNGRQTIYQMIQLADEVDNRGGQSLDPLEYKHGYHRLLWREVSRRIIAVTSGQTPAAELTVPESYRLLERLSNSEIQLYLASGTDLKYVRDEVRVLGLDSFFGEHIYGAVDDYRRFSKAMIIQQMIFDMGLSGDRIVGFGDGFVEIEEVKKVGGLAIGVASDEDARNGINTGKRKRLIEAGADIIIGDYREQDLLFQRIGLT
jgi:phosphoglycolate phosphatase-like HAD superfamily hydrolase